MPDVREVYEMVTKQAPRQPNALDRQLARQARAARNRKIGAMVVVVAIVASLAAYAVVQMRNGGSAPPAHHGATPVPTTNIGTVTITDTGCTLAGVTNLSGPFSTTVRNETGGPVDFVMFRIASDQRYERMLARVDRLSSNPHQVGPFGLYFFEQQNIVTSVKANDSLAVSATLDPGTYGIRCSPGDRTTDFIGPIDVR